MKIINLEQCAALLKELSGEVIVLTHVNPDGDTIGSAAALVRILRSIGKKAAAFTLSFPYRYKYLSSDYVFTKTLPESFSVIAVDIASPQQLGVLPDGFPDKIDILIDHHMQNTLQAEFKLVLQERSSAGEIIYELGTLLQVDFDKKTAEALYSAVSSDSGGFRFSSTSPRTHEIAADLLGRGIDCAKINRIIFDTITETQFLLYKLAYSILTKHCEGKVAVICFTEQLLEQYNITEPDYGEISQLGRRLEGVEVGITIRPGDNGGFRVSFRSNEYVNVADIASAFGGGGHYFAAACKIDAPAEEAVRLLLEETEKRL